MPQLRETTRRRRQPSRPACAGRSCNLLPLNTSARSCNVLLPLNFVSARIKAIIIRIVPVPPCDSAIGGWNGPSRVKVVKKSSQSCWAALVDVRLDVVPLLPRSFSQTVMGCRLGGYPAGSDVGWVGIQWKRSVGWRARCGRDVTPH